MIKSRIQDLLLETVRALHPEAPARMVSVSDPPKGVEADLSSGTALALAKSLSQNPKTLAAEIAARIPKGDCLKDVQVSGNGFLNFYLREEYLGALLGDAARGEPFPPEEKSGQAPPVLLEFVSANPTGPLHIGHGRGAALGDSLARIHRALGRPVNTEYYVNDVGVQMSVLARSVEAKARELGGEKDFPFPENGYRGAYVAQIARAMVEARRSDFDVFPRSAILEGIRKDLEDFGVAFDGWFPESDLHRQNKVEKALALLKERNALKEKEGALWFTAGVTEKEGEEPDKERVLRKSDGKYTYFASDVAYHADKFARGYGLCIDIWGHDHHGYVPRVEAALQALGYPRERLHILLYQLVSLKRGGKRVAMSTRSGEFVTLREILDEVGRDACRFFFAMRSPDSQLEFDVDLAKKQSNENPVYYVQYVHARICSIFREAEKRGIAYDPGAALDFSGGFEREERDLALKLGIFRDTLESAAALSSPNLLTTYLLDLAGRFHKFYDRHRVLEAEPRARQLRFALLRATQAIVHSGLDLLGVGAPEKM